jgi:multiple sugar transport system ATP-binding protein
MTLGGGSNGVDAKVIVVEPTGAETELLVQVGEAKLVLAVHGRVDARPDETVRLAIEAESVHLFDRQTGKRMGR